MYVRGSVPAIGEPILAFRGHGPPRPRFDFTPRAFVPGCGVGVPAAIPCHVDTVGTTVAGAHHTSCTGPPGARFGQLRKGVVGRVDPCVRVA